MTTALKKLGWRRGAKIIASVVAFGVMLVLTFGPTDWVVPLDPVTRTPVENLVPGAAQRTLGVFVLCMTLWMTGVIPLAATGMLALSLPGLVGAISARDAFGFFGNTATMFLLGVFLLAAATIETGLSKRLTLVFLSRFDQSPKRLVGGVILTAATLSLMMPEHAVAAMMFPIVLDIIEALKLKRPGSTYARALLLAMAWGAVTGGVGTFLGGGRAPLAVDLLRREFPDADIPTFFSWALNAIPIVIFTTAFVFWQLTRKLKFDVDDIRSATAFIAQRVERLGPMSAREKRVAGLLLLTILSWLFVPSLSASLLGKQYRVDVATISLLAAAGVFVLRIAPWPRLEEYVNWGVLVMYGGAVALGETMASTHAADWLATTVLPADVPGWMLFPLLAMVCIVLSEAISNAAVVALLVPVGFGMCHANPSLDPVTMIYMIAIPAGLGYTLPMSGPPCAIAYSAGYFRVGDVIKQGIQVNIVSLIIIVLIAYLYWPLVGLKL